MCNLRSSCMLIIVILTLIKISNVNLIYADPAIFVFGDSHLDAGNNNNLDGGLKANFKPYGIDFGRPSGRFTNGKTIVDNLGEEIGVDRFIRPYMAQNTHESVVINGVNYASAGGVIFDKFAEKYITSINMDNQIEYFAKTRRFFVGAINEAVGQKLIRTNSLFLVGVGMTDMFVNSRYAKKYQIKKRNYDMDFEVYVATLIKNLERQLQRLYRLDARKFIVENLPPFGCLPYVKYENSIKEEAQCHEYGNEVTRIFNSQLETLVSKLQRELEGSVFVYANVSHIVTDIIKNYKSYGFRNTSNQCCRTWKSLTYKCTSLSHVCKDRTEYVFWDDIHMTEAANMIIAKRIVEGETPDVSPMNVRELLNQKTF